MPYAHPSGFYGTQQEERADYPVAGNQSGHALWPAVTGLPHSFDSPSWQADSIARQLPMPQGYTQAVFYGPQPAQYGQIPMAPALNFHRHTNTTHGYHDQLLAHRHDYALPITGTVQGYTTPATHPRIICFFGGPCLHLTAPMLTGKASSIQKHLIDYHSAQLGQYGVGGVLSRCLWEGDDGRPCLKDVYGVSQLAKHIATVHLKLLEVMCKQCGGTFSRKDSLNRHRAGGRCLRAPE